MNNRIARIAKPLLILVLAIFVLYEGVKWTVFRVYVPPNKALMVTNKFGPPLPPDLIAVPTGQSNKGVQEDVRGP